MSSPCHVWWPLDILVGEMFLVCHVIRQDHLTKKSGDDNDKRLLR